MLFACVLGAKLYLRRFLHIENSLVVFFSDWNKSKISILCRTDRLYIKSYKITKLARKSIHHDVLSWDNEILPLDLNNFVRNSA